MLQPRMHAQLSLQPATVTRGHLPDVHMQRRHLKALVREYRWPAGMAPLMGASSAHTGRQLLLVLLIVAAHLMLIAWLMWQPELPVPPKPEPIMVSLLTMPSPKPTPVPEVVPVIQKKSVRQPVKQPQPRPVQQIERPVPVVQRMSEPSADQPKFEAKLAESAPPAEAPMAAVPAPVAAPAPVRPEIEEKEEPPKFGVAYLNNPAPEYPRLSKRAGEQGKVLMKVMVTAEGLPASVDVSKSSGFERLDAAAVTAVKQWRFEPARKGGKAISAYVIVPLSFTLN